MPDAVKTPTSAPDLHPEDFEPGTIDPGHGRPADARETPPDSPGTDGGTAGTGDNHVQDELSR